MLFFEIVRVVSSSFERIQDQYLGLLKNLPIFASEILERRGVFNPSFCFQCSDGRYKNKD
jgi:hypothetical protein